MTIEETLCNIARNNALIFTEEEQDAMAEVILAMQELEWYREQDLIRRKDAIDIMADHLTTNTENDIGICGYIAYREFNEIPKAEPPFAKDINVPDKLATDTNAGDNKWKKLDLCPYCVERLKEFVLRNSQKDAIGEIERMKQGKVISHRPKK